MSSEEVTVVASVRTELKSWGRGWKGHARRGQLELQPPAVTCPRPALRRPRGEAALAPHSGIPGCEDPESRPVVLVLRLSYIAK